MGGEDPTPPELTTGMGPEDQLFPETHPWDMEYSPVMGVSPLLSWGVVGKTELLPVPPLPQIRLFTEADYSAP